MYHNSVTLNYASITLFGGILDDFAAQHKLDISEGYIEHEEVIEANGGCYTCARLTEAYALLGEPGFNIDDITV